MVSGAHQMVFVVHEMKNRRGCLNPTCHGLVLLKFNARYMLKIFFQFLKIKKNNLLPPYFLKKYYFCSSKNNMIELIYL